MAGARQTEGISGLVEKASRPRIKALALGAKAPQKHVKRAIAAMLLICSRIAGNMAAKIRLCEPFQKATAKNALSILTFAGNHQHAGFTRPPVKGQKAQKR